jgi:LysR family transcriptional regulator, transcriptional activator of nhaA
MHRPVESLIVPATEKQSIFSPVEWLNYHHLLYFWTVVRTGSVAAASEELRLAPPTISVQIRRLEEQIGEKLLRRSGRHVVPTEMGQAVFRYADEIFTLGRELLDMVHGRPTGRPLQLIVGVVDVFPKSIAHWLIEPALRLDERVHIVCREATPEQLLAQLSVQQLDVVLSDAPIAPGVKVRAYNHLLGETGVSFLGDAKLARTHRRRFPKSLQGAPILLPTTNTAMRRSIDEWLETVKVKPSIVGEFEDSELLWEFGAAGDGIFPVPTVLEKHLSRLHRVKILGRTDAVRNRFYAISVERRLKHPAVVAICETARRELFSRR